MLGKLYSCMWKNEIRTFSNTRHKSKLKMDQRRKCKASTIKLLEENIGRTFPDINRSNIFLDPPPRVIKIKTKINKWDLIKLKDFCTVKETINKTKREPTEWEKMLANKVSHKGLISKIDKQLMQLYVQKIIKKGQKI